MKTRLRQLLSELRTRGLVPADAVVKALPGGKSGRVLLIGNAGRGVIVKVWDDLAAAERCAETLRLVRRLAPPAAPAILAVLSKPPVVVMEHVEGAMWAECLQTARPDAARVARQVGEALALLHRSTSSDAALRAHLDAGRDDLLRRAALRLGATSAEAGIRRMARSVINACAAQHRFLAHGDLSPLNVMVGKSRIAFVDFDMAWYGDAAFDVGMAAGALIGGHLRAGDRSMRAMLPRVLNGFVSGWRQTMGGEGPASEARAVAVALLRNREHVALRRLLLGGIRCFADVADFLAATTPID